MKKLMVGAAIAASMVMVGCKSVPTTESMHNISMAVGYSAGLIANETKIDDASRNAIVDIMNIVQSCTPEVGQTFEEAWTPIAQAHTDKLIADGKLTKEQGVLVMSGFNLAVKGLDYIFEVRFPEAKQYKELVSAAIDGFSAGFLAVFKPVNASDAAERAYCSRAYDKDAYTWLKTAK